MQNQIVGKQKYLSGRNKTGVVGVSFSNERRKWVAKITKEGVRHVIGFFEKFDDAVAARKRVELDLADN